ncbi:hypothetical protein MRX96_047516 [Rhipicephalus microplus]
MGRLEPRRLAEPRPDLGSSAGGRACCVVRLTFVHTQPFSPPTTAHQHNHFRRPPFASPAFAQPIAFRKVVLSPWLALPPRRNTASLPRPHHHSRRFCVTCASH